MNVDVAVNPQARTTGPDPRERTMGWRQGLLPAGMLLALSMAHSVAAATAPSCPNPVPIEKGNAEVQVAQIAGQAILFPYSRDVGIEWAASCLLGWYDRTDIGLGDLTDAVSNALLAMMTSDPVRFFAAAAKATPGQLDEWLGASIGYSQNQFHGQCVQPDRFAQARAAIGSLRMRDPGQEALRRRVVERLAESRCQIVEG